MIIYKVINAGARHPRTFTALCSLFSPKFSLQISINRRAHKTNILFRSQDIITGDEIISDTYDLKEIDDAVYQVDCKRVTRGVDNIGQFSTLPSSEFNKRRTWIIDGCCVTYRHRRQSVGRRGRGWSRGYWKASDWCRRWVPTQLSRWRGSWK